MLPESLVEVLAEVLPQAGDAYVVGARSPALVALLSERGLDLVVIEPVESALDALVEAIGEVPAIVVDPESAPYEPETADVVACTLNPSRYAVAAMKAAVKPGWPTARLVPRLGDRARGRGRRRARRDRPQAGGHRRHDRRR